MDKKKKLKTFFRSGTFNQWYRNAKRPLHDSKNLTDEQMKEKYGTTRTGMYRLAMTGGNATWTDKNLPEENKGKKKSLVILSKGK